MSQTEGRRPKYCASIERLEREVDGAIPEAIRDEYDDLHEFSSVDTATWYEFLQADPDVAAIRVGSSELQNTMRYVCTWDSGELVVYRNGKNGTRYDPDDPYIESIMDFYQIHPTLQEDHYPTSDPE